MTLRKSTFFIMRNRFILLLLLLPAMVSGQVNDAGLWSSINLQKKLNGKFTVDLCQEFRFNENISELGSFFTEASLQYKINKRISVSAGYRFINKRELDDHYSKRHRALIDLNLKHKISKVTAAARIRFQSQFADYYSSETGKIPENYLRTKLTFKYDTGKRITPSIGGETFVNLNRAEGMLLDTYRLSAGLEYEINKRTSVEVGYLLDKEIQVSEPWTSYITTVGFNYNF